MGSLEPGYWLTGSVADSVPVITAVADPLTVYQSLSLLERVGLQFGAPLLLGILVLGLTPEYGTSTLTITRRSPVISAAIGTLVAPVLAGLLAAGWLIVDAEVGVFFAVPLICISGPLLAAWMAVGYAGIGGFVAGRVGYDQQWTWVLVGATISGVAALLAPVDVLLAAVAAVLGCGAGVRGVARQFGSDGPDERTVPPANKV